MGGIWRGECNKLATQYPTSSPNYPTKAWTEEDCLLSSQLQKFFRIGKNSYDQDITVSGKPFQKKGKILSD